ncbi:TPA: hypothetical protein ACRNDK_002652 [Pseudomonas aeruginosa]
MIESIFDVTKNRISKIATDYIIDCVSSLKLEKQYYIYQSENKHKTFIMTCDKEFFEYNRMYYERFDIVNKPKRVKFIDLRECEDFGFASTRVTQIRKYKAVKSVSLITKLTRLIASRVDSVNEINFDNATLQAFDDTFHNVDFFKFKERVSEYKFLVSLHDKKKIIKRFNLNIGDLTIVYSPKMFSCSSPTFSTEKRANRCSNESPVFQLENCEYVAEINENNSRYREMIEQNRIVEKMIEI